MKTLLILACLCLPLVSNSQTEAIDEFYAAHHLGENNIKIKLGNSLLTMGSWFIEEPAARALVRKANHARILISEDQGEVSRGDINKLVKNIRHEGFESLVLVRDGLEKVEVYAREDRDYIRNLLVIVQAEDNFIMASLDCRMTFADIEAAIDEEL
jgi:hypothetical protein